MKEKREAIRKTISLDKDLLSTCEVLYSEAGVDNFTQFTVNALQMYTEYLLSQKQRPLLAREVRKALKDEVRPIASRLSKGLYRYAILLDMMCQIAACLNFAGDTSILEKFRKNANVRVAKMRGQIDIKSIIDDGWIDCMVDEDDDW